MKTRAAAFFICLLSFACGEKKTSVSDFSWIEGKWEGSYDGTDFFEEWQPLNGNVLDGQGGALSGRDTVFSEFVRIEQRGEDLFYIADVKGNEGSVDFKFTGFRNDSIVFENPTHDFPQRIVYLRIPGDKLYACIDGLNNGKYQRMEFSYHKVR